MTYIEAESCAKRGEIIVAYRRYGELVLKTGSLVSRLIGSNSGEGLNI
jgi:hypothetical protein